MKNRSCGVVEQVLEELTEGTARNCRMERRGESRGTRRGCKACRTQWRRVWTGRSSSPSSTGRLRKARGTCFHNPPTAAAETSELEEPPTSPRSITWRQAHPASSSSLLQSGPRLLTLFPSVPSLFVVEPHAVENLIDGCAPGAACTSLPSSCRHRHGLYRCACHAPPDLLIHQMRTSSSSE